MAMAQETLFSAGESADIHYNFGRLMDHEALDKIGVRNRALFDLLSHIPGLRILDNAPMKCCVADTIQERSDGIDGCSFSLVPPTQHYRNTVEIAMNALITPEQLWIATNDSFVADIVRIRASRFDRRKRPYSQEMVFAFDPETGNLIKTAVRKEFSPDRNEKEVITTINPDGLAAKSQGGNVTYLAMTRNGIGTIVSLLLSIESVDEAIPVYE
jgi:hypothetical protein